MKKQIPLLLALFAMTVMVHAQAPNALPYQAVARNSNGNLIASQNVSLRFSIHDATANGTVVYRETQNATTNVLGLFSVNIGQGTLVPGSGTFAAINWGSGAKFTQVEIDTTGGTNYTDMGTQQMMSVPYALYAATSGSSNVPNGTAAGQMLYWNGSMWVAVAPGINGQNLTYCNGVPTWGPCPVFPATLNTSEVSSITSTTGSSGGNITNDGGAPVTARGVCWSTSENPTIANDKTINGTGTGTFISSITGLSLGTAYYVRAYATNSIGTSYGNQVSFTTLAELPTLTTSATSPVTGGSASGGGNITSDGGAAVTARGVCWSTSENPTIANDKTTDATGTGSFISSITGLTLGNTYYVRAYATNSIGTSYGNQVSFVALTIGDSYQGGKVAYILQPGDPGYVSDNIHGLIVATSDQGAIQWYNGTNISVATGTILGTGNTNTNSIVSAQGPGSYAAQLCADLVLGGYSDWYLPSKDELNKIYLNKTAIGFFGVGSYWSSSENSPETAWQQSFMNGSQGISFKLGGNFVRAVRSF